VSEANRKSNIPTNRWVDVKIIGGKSSELREAAAQIVKIAERSNAIFSGDRMPKEVPDYVTQK
jgi:hypothetical protein